MKEIAAVLDVPAGTIKSRLFTARQRLREQLAEPLTEAAAQPAVPAPREFAEKEVVINGLSTSQIQR